VPNLWLSEAVEPVGELGVVVEFGVQVDGVTEVAVQRVGADVLGFDEVREDPIDRPLCDADPLADLCLGEVGFAVDELEDLAVE